MKRALDCRCKMPLTFALVPVGQALQPAVTLMAPVPCHWQAPDAQPAAWDGVGGCELGAGGCRLIIMHSIHDSMRSTIHLCSILRPHLSSRGHISRLEGTTWRS